MESSRATRGGFPLSRLPPRSAHGGAALALLLFACTPDTPPTPADSGPAPVGAATSAGLSIHFTDVTSESGVDLVLTSGREPPSQILEVKGGGLALLDLENDGDLDLFAPNGATLESPRQGPGARLYANQGGLRFVDRTRDVGLDFARWGFGVAAADVDGDAHTDLYVCCLGPNALLRNDGGQRLVELPDAGGAAGGDLWSTAAAFGDLDLDGDLDLYIANYLHFDPEHPPAPISVAGVKTFAGPAGLEPEPDVLYENQGDGRFVDITAASGCADVPPAFGLGVVILDLDGNGQQDVFVGNDSQPNYLFRNQTGLRFRDVGLESGIALNGEGAAQATMGIAIADVGGDGFADVFTTNFANDTNTLHETRDGTSYDDRTAARGLGAPSRPFVGWAAGFCDFDHDGDEDLLAFDGHVWPPDVVAALGQKVKQTPLLFAREGERFRRVTSAEAGPWLDEEHCDRSAAFGDLDRDGDVDVVVGERNGPVRILRNDRDGGDWIAFRIADHSSAGNHEGLGSRLVLRADGLVQSRWIHSGGSYQASSPPEAHFAVPDGVGELTLELTRPDGIQERHEHLEPRKLLGLGGMR